jgi:DNA (cytosine-5)-methyltransferase 1
MERGEIDLAPIWDDVKTLRGSMLPKIDIIYGGFPCTDISVAGRGAGLAGERSGLFFEITRLVGEIRPRFIFLENVPVITFRGLDAVTATLAGLRYDCRWGMLSAYDMGAPHRRMRWWLLAHSRDVRRQMRESKGKGIQRENETCHEINPSRSNVAHTNGAGWRGQRRAEHLPSSHLAIERSGKIMADTAGGGREEGNEDAGRIREGTGMEEEWNRLADSDKKLDDADEPRLEGQEPEGKLRGERKGLSSKRDSGDRWTSDFWAIESPVGRLAYGLSYRCDRLKCLGNSVVPQCAREAFKRLIGLTPTERG